MTARLGASIPSRICRYSATSDASRDHLAQLQVDDIAAD